MEHTPPLFFLFRTKMSSQHIRWSRYLIPHKKPESCWWKDQWDEIYEACMAPYPVFWTKKEFCGILGSYWNSFNGKKYLQGFWDGEVLSSLRFQTKIRVCSISRGQGTRFHTKKLCFFFLFSLVKIVQTLISTFSDKYISFFQTGSRKQLTITISLICKQRLKHSYLPFISSDGRFYRLSRLGEISTPLHFAGTFLNSYWRVGNLIPGAGSVSLDCNILWNVCCNNYNRKHGDWYVLKMYFMVFIQHIF